MPCAGSKGSLICERSMPNVVVLLEIKDTTTIRPASLHAIAFGRDLSRALGVTFSLVLVGHDVGDLAEHVRGCGAARVFVFDDSSLKQPLAERVVPSLLRIVEVTDASYVVGAATAQGKDVLPRLAESIDAAYVGDCIGFEQEDGKIIWRRPVMAGNAIAHCGATTQQVVVSVRQVEFRPAEEPAGWSPVEFIQMMPTDSDADRVEFIGFEAVKSSRPELSEARVVVSGGRPLSNRFEDVLGPLADVLNAALGATRAICDAGHAPGDYQVGQTGKAVAPDLYIAVGISGAIQHVAGIKGAKTIVAINSDPDAPIMFIADYMFVGNLFNLVPELVHELHCRRQAT